MAIFGRRSRGERVHAFGYSTTQYDRRVRRKGALRHRSSAAITIGVDELSRDAVYLKGESSPNTPFTYSTSFSNFVRSRCPLSTAPFSPASSLVTSPLA